MGVFLIILKIIGVILAVFLSVIGFLLLIALLALIIPIGYEVFVDKSDKLSYRFSVKYFVFSVLIKQNKPTVLKIFNKQLIPRKKKKERRSKQNVNMKSDNDDFLPERAPYSRMPSEPDEPKLESVLDETELQTVPDKTELESVPDETSKEEKTGHEPPRHKKTKHKKTRHKKTKAEKPKNQKTNSEKTSSKFGIDFLREYVLKKSVLKAVCRLIIRILKKVLPKEHRIRLVIGLDDPAMTGQILAVCGIITGALSPSPNIEASGDFEKQRLECEMMVAGRFSLISIVFALLRFALTRDIWKIIKYYMRKEDDGNGDS